MAKKASGKSKGGKRMADGGAAGASNMMYREPGANPGSMPGRKPGRGIPAVEPGGNGMGRPMRPPGRGRPSFLGGGRTNYPGIEGPGGGSMGRNPPALGLPTTGGKLPPMQKMGPDNMGPTSVINGRTPGVSSASVMPTPMGRGGSMDASTGLTPTGGGVMAPNMTRDYAGPVGMKMGMRGGGLARKGKGQTLAKGGLVKGSGCAARGVKKPRYT